MPVTTRGRTNGETKTMSSFSNVKAKKRALQTLVSSTEGAPGKVLEYGRLLKYARELRDQGKHGFLYDVAERVHGYALREAKVSSARLEKPSLKQSDNELYDNITHNALLSMGSKVSKKISNVLSSSESDSYFDTNGKHEAGVVYKKVRDPSFMAQQIIKAERYRSDPDASEIRRAKQKGIQWDMKTDDNSVRVRRLRKGGTKTCWSYPCASQKELNGLVKTVQKERDDLLKRGYFA